MTETASTSIQLERFMGPVNRSIGLLILQPSPFCNIDCDYCYLPDRLSTKRMSPLVLRKTLENVFESGLVGEKLSLVWHAGEPLAVPRSYYEPLFDIVSEFDLPRGRILHSMQTNGTLLNGSWCDFIQTHHINLGVSIDGPAFVHDLHRKNRRGIGTHKAVMRGIECLREHRIPFHAIAVVTADSLDSPDEIFDFFLQNEIRDVGFNVEELEGVHQISTLNSRSIDPKMRRFFGRLYERQKRSGGAMRIREFDRAYQAIAGELSSPSTRAEGNDQTLPFGIVSVDCDGSFSTFSPELLGIKSLAYGDFSFGNVSSQPMAEILNRPELIHIAGEIQAGVNLCANSCEYFPLCGGGAPANKFFENGSFASTTTMYCRHTIQLPIDIVLADLEASLVLGETS